MMSTILLRFAAPMQSWGSASRFDIRRTEREPTKSGATGLLAAALGRRRDDPIDDLAAMRFGVRIDREGVLLRDFHIARKMKKNDPTQVDSSYVTHRYYLCDAVFLVGFESEDEALLKKLADAIQSPVYPLFLGRRSCPPQGKVLIGIRPLPLEEALREEPLLAIGSKDNRILMDAHNDGRFAVTVMDVPKSYSPNSRQYTYRAIRQTSKKNRPTMWEHDPMAELE